MPSRKPTVAVVRMQLCDYREACGGSRACCSRRRLDRPRNSAHPGILDDRQHVLGDCRRALRHRWPGPAELALASATCRPVVAARGRRYGSHLLRRSQQPSRRDRRARPAIPRSMFSGDTCVAPRYSNGLTTGYRIAGAEAFELEGMDPSYIDIDGFRLKDADIKGPESAPIAN
jgi:hypothetical protein